MRREASKRIDTNAASQTRPGLNAAFNNLEIPDLPAAEPSKPSAEVPDKLWKMGRVVLRRETAHRGGKTVVVIDEFATHLPASVLESLAKKLRQTCGTGGTVRGRAIEIQGDQPAKIRALLEAEGFQVAGVK